MAYNTKDFGDNRLKRITRFLYRWSWCSWVHRKHRCYPRFRGFNDWHCTKCHCCGEEVDIIILKTDKFKWF